MAILTLIILWVELFWEIAIFFLVYVTLNLKTIIIISAIQNVLHCEHSSLKKSMSRITISRLELIDLSKMFFPIVV